MFFIEFILALSYGKDSLACLGAIKNLGLPLDRIVHSEIWATHNISADFPEMVEFKKYADKIIYKEFGIVVEHITAKRVNGVEKDCVTYEDVFYRHLTRGNRTGSIYGFPMLKGSWCKKLKCNPFDNIDTDFVQYLGIACDEPDRIDSHISRSNVFLPLVAVGWSEADCYQWCLDNDLLSPIYNSSSRGGCWFCHNQSVEQLRLLRKNYPDLWDLLLKWDNDSPFSFKPDGHTVHDFDTRFQLEDEHLLSSTIPFRWSSLEMPLQYSFY